MIFFWYPGWVISNQPQDFIINNLIADDIIDDIFAIWKLYVIDIREYTSDYYRRDMLEAVFQDDSYFYRTFYHQLRSKGFYL